ncbi:MAG: AAA family ATPase, partial [Candidatus Brocadiia bacterium]|nr:AAA family ATPase [Candidatus Brocadiia bacterium]
EKAGVFELMQQESHLQNQIGMLSAQQATLAGRLKRQQDRRDHLSGQRDRLSAERTEVQGRLAAVRRELEQVRGDKAVVDNRLSESALHMGRLTSEIGEMKAELKGRISRRQVIQDLQDTAEGVGSGVKLILAEIARPGSPLAGSPGLLADLLEVPRRDALALEAALGHRVQGIVVNTRLQAVEALQLLRRGRKGRAEVIVLEDLAVAPRLEVSRGGGEAARLADLVRVSGGAEPAVEALLGNCFVVDEAEAAQRLLAGELPSGVRIVTRKGECFEPGGLWSAGEPETGSLISRRSELTELAVEIGELKSRLDALSGEGERCAASMATLERERAALASQREELGEQENDLRSRHALLTSQEEQRAEELELIGSEISSLSEDIEGAEQRSVQASGEAESVRGRRSEREGALEGLKAELRRERELQERLMGEVSALRSELARREEQLSGLKALAERQRGELRHRQEELGGLARQREAGEGLRREADERIRVATAEQAVLEQERAVLAALAREKAGAVEQVRAAMEERQALAERATEERDGAERDLQQLRLMENEFRLKLENLGERVAEECGVRLAALERDPDSWREEPPFTDVQIDEFAAHEEQPQAMVARWYAEAESAPPEAEESADEPGRRKVCLADAIELREGVLGIANDPETDWEATGARVETLKKQVGQMGGANLDAIREQDELEVRAQFLTNQKDDLDRARRQELEIIRELSVKSRQNFLETFEAVQANFQVIVRKLFGGGAGEIMLEGDVEDVLEAGIEIMVRPPGKETRSISLLSGGEKALSAVALLFAIFKAKPSPFCVLDEVDAPLDEANVGRFISLVQEYCENTQFVIVTHNKVTMGAAQTLYGISLREDGVSQKVAVNFSEVDSRLEEMRRQTRQAQGRAKAG